ncbi:hypothetical protein GCM10023231_01730 [Olivibacter ginsenosidimutans]|uniref:Nuclear transport factor 2 family protein n=1 Tax=Olivibacter ginsenosidimutans TaxID=1176537 RepID=A0ABP9ACQ2_9SPHI
MKTFITSIAAAIIFISNSAFANTEGKANRSTVAAINHSLDLYTDALTNGQVAGLDQLFSEQFQQRYSTKKAGHTFGKEQVLGFLKKQKNIRQDCETDYSIVDENKGVAIAKVTMKYATFSRVDYVTVAQSKDDYQITQVVTTFE